MIRFDRVTVTFAEAVGPVLRDVTFEVEEGELCLVVGPTGAGKSTLLGAVNGLVPHFTGGTLAGEVRVDGRSTATHRPRDMAGVVGVVGQDPSAGFVTDTVQEELAYGMEQLGVAPGAMRARLEETLDLLGLADLRDVPLGELSGGQAQRVAIGSVLAVHPRVLVLDEPTSALDPAAAEEVLAGVDRLVHDVGVTVVMAEHRLERVVHHADRVAYLAGDGSVVVGDPGVVLAGSAVVPPVVALGRLVGWDPLPLSVRDARRRAAPLRALLAPPPASAPAPAPAPAPAATAGTPVDGTRPPLLRARGVVVRYGDLVAVRGVDIDLAPGAVVALMGRNGSGKTSLLWALQGSGRRRAGTVEVGGADPAALSPRDARRRVGLVPQTAADLLYLATVDLELAQADRESAASPGPPARDLLDRLAPGVAGFAHPRDLSEGQRLALVLAVQLRAGPQVVLLDEPTRGLDYRAKDALAAAVAGLAVEGRAVVVATHDVEMAAAVANRVVVMGDGDVVADGPAADVLLASPSFAPQVAKVLAPLPYLTVAAVADDLRRAS